MDKVRFLFDEDFSHTVIEALVREEPAIDLVVVGKPGGPPFRTPDPVLLDIAFREGRLFPSRDKQTLPRHLTDHFTQGKHTFGVAVCRHDFSLARIKDDLLMNPVCDGAGRLGRPDRLHSLGHPFQPIGRHGRL